MRDFSKETIHMEKEESLQVLFTLIYHMAYKPSSDFLQVEPLKILKLLIKKLDIRYWSLCMDQTYQNIHKIASNSQSLLVRRICTSCETQINNTKRQFGSIVNFMEGMLQGISQEDETQFSHDKILSIIDIIVSSSRQQSLEFFYAILKDLVDIFKGNLCVIYMHSGLIFRSSHLEAK